MGDSENLDSHDFWIFGNPWEPLFVDLNIPNYFHKSKEIWETCSNNIMFWKIAFGYLGISGTLDSRHVGNLKLWDLGNT